MRTLLALAAPALLCAPAAAQLAAGTITDANAVFRCASFPTSISSTGGLNDFRVTGAAGTDQLFQTSWYWRLDTDPREYAFHNDTATQAAPMSTYAGNLATLVWPNADNRGISAVLQIDVYSTGTTSGVAVQRMTVTNNTGGPVSLNLYGYVDFDQCGATNDSAAANPATNKITVTDAAACATGEVFAPGADRYECNSWPNVRTKLTDANQDDLSNAGLPFGPADFTGAWQWQDRPLAAGASLTVHLVLAQDFVHSGCLGTAGAATSGAGKAGTNGLAAFDTTIRPYLGRLAILTLDNGLGGAQPVYLFGANSASIAFPPIGTFLIDPASAIVFYGTPFDALNTSQTRIPIPNQAALCSASVLFQGFWLDPGAVGSFAHSDRLRWLLGGLN